MVAPDTAAPFRGVHNFRIFPNFPEPFRASGTQEFLFLPGVKQ